MTAGRGYGGYAPSPRDHAAFRRGAYISIARDSDSELLARIAHNTLMAPLSNFYVIDQRACLNAARRRGLEIPAGTAGRAEPRQ